MKRFDLSLYLVLDPDLCGGRAGMVETARIAANHGVRMVQLRAPNWKKRQWLETALALKQVLAGSGVALIINDQVDVALAVDADGVHVGQADLPPEMVRKLIGPDKLLGLSVASADQLAASSLAGVDYLGVGPIYPTSTKTDAAPVLGLSGLTELLSSINLPVVAIGGIQPGICAPIIAAGAQGVAVVSAICGQPDVAVATAALRREIDHAICHV
ncbi:MAG: thiamine-phosphate diphosphorylase [Proteobacteria bacterium]|nr:thiamine-phosphate diphosphorylase [Pseudomonadota bacterium]